MYGYNYIVVAWSELDGRLVDYFDDRKQAEDFARDVTAEGYCTMLFQQIASFDAQATHPEVVALPGIDYPATLTRPSHAA